jgi:hypothetical protein
MEQAKDARVATELMSYIQTYYGPILERGHGMSFTQNLYVLGVLNTLVFTKTRDPRYFIAARTYTEKGAELSPTRPQFLYALFDLYRVENNAPKVQEIGNRILSQWPGDERARSLLIEYMARQTAPSPATKTEK